MIDKSDIKLTQNDKIVGGVLVGLAAMALTFLLYAFYLALPSLIRLAQNTLYLGVLLVLLILFAMVVLDKNTWRTVYYKWKNISRNIRRRIIREDPIGVLTTAIERMKKKQSDIEASLIETAAARKQHDAEIEQITKKADEADGMAAAAHNLRKTEGEVTRHVIAADRWRKAAAEMMPMSDKLAEYQTKLQQALDYCTNNMADLENQREVLAVRLSALKRASSTADKFRSFFGANPDLGIHAEAVEEVELQIAESEANIDQLLHSLNPRLQDEQLRQEASAAKAMQKFDKFLTEAKPVPQLVVSTTDKVPVER